MKIPKVLRENLLLKMTSLNAVVISIRLVISLFIQRFLAELVGEEGISKIGQLRNFSVLLTSTTTVHWLIKQLIWLRTKERIRYIL